MLPTQGSGAGQAIEVGSAVNPRNPSLVAHISI
jgi:hypothetical protein